GWTGVRKAGVGRLGSHDPRTDRERAGAGAGRGVVPDPAEIPRKAEPQLPERSRSADGYSALRREHAGTGNFADWKLLRVPRRKGRRKQGSRNRRGQRRCERHFETLLRGTLR